MNWTELVINAEVVGNIVGAIVGFILGIVATNIVQSRRDKRDREQRELQKVQLSYSRKLEVPFKIVKEELKDKLKIMYQETEIQELYFYNLQLENTGNKTIWKQSFICLLAEGTKLIDPLYPKISTKPRREVGPIERDDTITSPNEFRYTIEALGVGQVVNVDFLTLEDPSTSFEVIFKPNEREEVEFKEVFREPLLTPLQNEILGLVRKGLNTQEIAEQIPLSRRMVMNYLNHLKYSGLLDLDQE